MLSLAIVVVAIALPDSLNPSLIAADLFLASEQNPRRRTIAFALAVWTVTFVFGLALALGLGDLILSLIPKPGARLKYELITAAGLVLVAGGIVVLARRKALASTGRSPGAVSDNAQGSPVLLGAGIGGLELLTAFPYFAAIAMIVGSSVSSAYKVFLLVLYCVVYTLPLIGIAAVCFVMGQRAASVLRPVMEFVGRFWPIVVGPLAAAVGIGVAAFGIARLSSI
ncbi:MAG: GAP family protein [Solirubrobacteraceae bacterium]